MHKIHKKQTYQCHIKLPYKSIYKNENCEIYEYEHYTLLNKGNVELSTPSSKVKVYKIETAEELVIARDTYRLTK